jgi:hypothetical protein
LEFPGEGEAFIGREVKDLENLHVGDHLEIETDLGRYSADSSKVDLKVVKILPPLNNRWDTMILTDLNFAQKKISELQLNPELIWKSSILSFFLVDGVPSARHTIREIIEKKTVAGYIDTNSEIKNLLDFIGLDRKRERVFNALLLGISLLCLFSVCSAHFQVLKDIGACLKKSGYGEGKIYLIFFLNFLLIAVPGIFFGIIFA